MVELDHEYDASDTRGSLAVSTYNNSVGGTNPAQILGSALTANTKYLTVARALYGGRNTTDRMGCRVQTDNDSLIETKSEMIMEPEQTGTAEYVSYLFAHSFITSDLPADVEFQIAALTGGTVDIDHSSLFLLDLDAISAPNLLETAYFDASDAGPTDASANWTNDSNAFDGSTSTNANSASQTGSLTGEGTTASTSGSTIGLVEVRVLANTTGADDLTITVDEDSVGGTELGSLVHAGQLTGWKSFLLIAPSGGWTWQKVNDLAITFNPGGVAGTVEAYKAEVRVYDVNGLGYFEDVQANSGDEYSTSLATTVLASLAGSDLGTDEHWILGYSRTDIGSTGRYFRIDCHNAYDTSTALSRFTHFAEGEDTSEQRIVGVSVRHKASSGTPDVTLYGNEEAANGNMLDGGAYLIALPTVLFADFVDVYTAAGISINGTETTIQTSGSYTPIITGNHLIIGIALGDNTPTALGGMWVESTTTEIRTGDSTPTHNQIWDNTKDQELMATFQRYSITTAETFNLRAQGAGSQFGLQDRWLIVVNLNEPATGATVYPPFPRRQKPTVRM